MEFTGGDSSGFPLDVWTHGYYGYYAFTLNSVTKDGSTLRGTRASIIASDEELVDLEGARDIITRRGRAFLALAASPRDGATGSHLS